MLGSVVSLSYVLYYDLLCYCRFGYTECFSWWGKGRGKEECLLYSVATLYQLCQNRGLLIYFQTSHLPAKYCQRTEHRFQNFFPFFSVWISILGILKKKKKKKEKKNPVMIYCFRWWLLKKTFLFSWKCHNSFGIDQTCHETTLDEGHETFRAVIYFQGSGLIIITNT